MFNFKIFASYCLVVLLCVGCSSGSYIKGKEHSYSLSDLKCMAEAIHGEARGESVAGQVFVGQVILTRLKRGYASSICKVVHARRQFAPKGPAKRSSYRSARVAMSRGANGVTHFHSYKRRKTSRASFSISKKCNYAFRIGNHWGFTCGRRGLASVLTN